jgi:hypothetical protein
LAAGADCVKGVFAFAVSVGGVVGVLFAAAGVFVELGAVALGAGAASEDVGELGALPESVALCEFCVAGLLPPVTQSKPPCFQRT